MTQLKIALPISVLLFITCQLMGLELLTSIRNSVVGGIGSYLGALVIFKAYSQNQKEYKTTKTAIHQITLSCVALVLMIVVDFILNKYKVDTQGIFFITSPFILMAMLLAIAASHTTYNKQFKNIVYSHITGLIVWLGSTFIYLLYIFNTHGS